MFISKFIIFEYYEKITVRRLFYSIAEISRIIVFDII